MLLGSGLDLIIGVVIAVALVGIGAGLGRRFLGRSPSPSMQEAISDGDGERVLQLLQDLGAWTSEYSGNVNEYQSEIGAISNAMTQGGSAKQADARVMMLLQQIMDSNDKLKTRLDAAERQLEKQTVQIESYLTEARTDGLTGLANRRAFDQELEKLFIAYRNGGRSFVVVLFDIDKFKSINDTHGHQAGDRVLQHLARTLRTELSQAIIVGRFGGEEFAVITDGPLRLAADRMNEVRKHIEKVQIDVGTAQIKLTVSIGLSEPRDDLVISPVLKRADEALYTAKNIGRNRVYYHDGKAPTLVGAPEIARKED
ncbi:MAG: GGDEF domain-containing protein [Rubripirellula sp.]